MATRKRPFPSHSAAIESIDNLCELASHGLKALEKRYRLDAPSVRKQIAETKRGLVLMAKERAWRGR